MRISDIDILIVPDRGNAGPDHWQSRWERNLRTARRVMQTDWERPTLADWSHNIAVGVAEATRPVVMVAHGFGVTASVAAAAELARSQLRALFLVGPVDHEADAVLDPRAVADGFAPMPMASLPVPSKLIGSSNDALCSVERVQTLGRAWGSDVSIIANAGHIDAASGQGPWPEGLLTFGQLLRQLR